MTEQLRQLEARVVAGARTVGDFNSIMEADLGADDLQYYGDLYRYVAAMVETHGLLPRLSDLQDTFNIPPGLSLRKSTPQWRADLEELCQLRLVRRIQDSVGRVVEEHSGDPSVMLQTLIRELADIQIVDRHELSTTDGSAEARLALYAARAAALEAAGTGVAGLPTGVSLFDTQTRLGWLPGELIAIVARTYMGKTWMLMAFGMTAWLAGARVLMISPELSVDEAEARFDVLLAGRFDVNVQLDDLYRGFQPPAAFRDLLREHASKRKDWITVASANQRPFTVSEINRLIRQHEPQLVLVDGMNLVRPEKGQASRAVWENMTDIIAGVKNMAVGLNVPLIFAHQANRAAGNVNRPPALHEIAHSDAIAYTCDRVLTLSHFRQIEEEEADKYLRVTVQKFRRGRADAVGVRFYFQPGRGKIYEQPLDSRTTGIPGDTGEGGEEWEGTDRVLSIP